MNVTVDVIHVGYSSLVKLNVGLKQVVIILQYQTCRYASPI